MAGSIDVRSGLMHRACLLPSQQVRLSMRFWILITVAASLPGCGSETREDAVSGHSVLVSVMEPSLDACSATIGNIRYAIPAEAREFQDALRSSATQAQSVAVMAVDRLSQDCWDRALAPVRRAGFLRLATLNSHAKTLPSKTSE